VLGVDVLAAAVERAQAIFFWSSAGQLWPLLFASSMLPGAK